jgi:hypothetical protein
MVMGVSMKVGQMVLTRMPDGPRSIHRLGQAFRAHVSTRNKHFAGASDMAHLRRHLDDRSLDACLDLPTGDGLSNQERRSHIERENDVEIRSSNVGEGSRQVGPGIADQHVKRRFRPNQISDGFKIGHVDTAGIGELAAGANGLRGSLDFLLISGDERDRT